MASGIRQPVIWDWRSRISNYVDVAIRVPPLFVMDLLLSDWSTSPPITEGEKVIDTRLTVLLLSLAYTCLFLSAFLVFILDTAYLHQTYLFLSSFWVLHTSYQWNKQYVDTAISLSQRNSSIFHEFLELNTKVILNSLGNYMLQIFLGIGFLSTVYPRSRSTSWLFSLWIIFISPTFFTMFAPLVPASALPWSPIISKVAALIVLLYEVLVNSASRTTTLRETIEWTKAVVANEGVFVLFKSQWQRLHVPQVLRFFWLARFLGNATILLSEAHSQNLPINWLSVGRDLLVNGCDNTISLMGMTSVVSVLSHYISMGMKVFLQMDDADQRNMGSVSAILFFVLAMQSGLTGMEADKRLNRLYQNVCLLITAILHFFHSMLNSLLQLLGASLNSPREKHIRALLASTFLIVFPMTFMYVVWTRHNLSTWLLALSCFSTEVVVKVIVSLVIYVLLIIDARLDSSWEPFDDYVYVARAVGSFLEIIFGMFLLFNGAWIFFFEQSGTIRAFTILFHAYFNVWTQAKQGWANSVRRREAGRRSAGFRRATAEQLGRLDDVCSICHHEMEAAIVTDCQHFYHVNCLRRWLFMQNNCPLCHSDLVSKRPRSEDQTVEPVEMPEVNGEVDEAQTIRQRVDAAGRRRSF